MLSAKRTRALSLEAPRQELTKNKAFLLFVSNIEWCFSHRKCVKPLLFAGTERWIGCWRLTTLPRTTRHTRRPLHTTRNSGSTVLIYNKTELHPYLQARRQRAPFVWRGPRRLCSCRATMRTVACRAPPSSRVVGRRTLLPCCVRSAALRLRRW